MGKPRTKAQNKYIAKKYDRINLTIEKGEKEVLQAYAAARGESVNGFINRAINETIERDGGTGEESANRICLPAPPERKAAISAHAESQGESVNSFIDRAIDSQIERDALRRRLTK